MHAPSIFSWVPDSGRYFNYFYPAGLIAATAVGLIFSVLVYKIKDELTPPILIELALLSVMLIPFVLPKMHERNFYPADVISILFAFYFPRYFVIPILMNIISFFSYQPTLFNVEPVPISLLALCLLILIIILSRDAGMQVHARAIADRNGRDAVK
jgi:Gpi18-like mannosyltransferase